MLNSLTIALNSCTYLRYNIDGDGHLHLKLDAAHSGHCTILYKTRSKLSLSFPWHDSSIITRITNIENTVIPKLPYHYSSFTFVLNTFRNKQLSILHRFQPTQVYTFREVLVMVFHLLRRVIRAICYLWCFSLVSQVCHQVRSKLPFFGQFLVTAFGLGTC